MNEDEIMAEVRKQRATILETHGGSLENTMRRSRRAKPRTSPGAS